MIMKVVRFMQKKACVIGLGYIGLPTALVLANNGWRVKGVDINPEVVKSINNKSVHIKESGLEDIIDDVMHNGLSVAMSPVESDVFIITVPTPIKPDLTTELKYLKDAVNSILPVLQKGNLIIVESTIPPRTMQDIIYPVINGKGYKVGQDIYLAYCPERVLPGKILEELIENNRIVGGVNKESAIKAANFYRTFVKGNIHLTDVKTAEMTKLMENTYRDVNIALSNELTKIAKNLRVNPLEVIKLANMHPRVNIHQPGPGVGGHCIPIDPYFIMEKDPKNSVLIDKARKINESMPEFVFDQIRELAEKESTITLFGLTYKGNIDDVRESPALDVMNILNNKGYSVKTYDPYVKQGQLKNQLCTFKESLENSDLVVILSEHSEFEKMDWAYMEKHMNNVQVLDTKDVVKNKSHKGYYSYANLYELNKIKV